MVDAVMVLTDGARRGGGYWQASSWPEYVPKKAPAAAFIASSLVKKGCFLGTAAGTALRRSNPK